jgi:hypothetical protein
LENIYQVKKQPKYSFSRWALSGRNDLYLNSLCQEIQDVLEDSNITFDERKQILLLFQSDLRTHLTERKYQEIMKFSTGLCRLYSIKMDVRL